MAWLLGAVNGAARLPVNEVGLRRAWESSQRSTKEDWAEWMRHFSVELLKESPSPALRATHSLAQVGVLISMHPKSLRPQLPWALAGVNL